MRERRTPLFKHGSAQIGSVPTCDKSMQSSQYILLRVIAATEYALMCHEPRDRRLQNCRAAISTHSRRLRYSEARHRQRHRTQCGRVQPQIHARGLQTAVTEQIADRLDANPTL